MGYGKGGRAAGPRVRGCEWAFLCVCVWLCREKPPCEGLFLALTAEVSEANI